MTNRRYEIGVEETRYYDEEEEMQVEECEEEDLLSDDEAEAPFFNPIPYHFKLKDVLGEPVDLLPDDMAKVRVNCPPFHTLLDHCLAVLWIAFNRESTSTDMLHSGDLNWAIKFLEGLKNNQNRRTDDVQMALDFLQRALHNLCVGIQVDDVRRKKFKRYMDLSRSINSLQFNRGVILKNAEEGAPDYAAFVKCIDRKKNATYIDSTLPGSPCLNDPCSSPCPTNTCASPCPPICPTNPCGSTCPSDPSRAPCPSDVCGDTQPVCPNADEELDADVCEMLDLIGDTPPIILMDLLDHYPELLAKAMAKGDDECDININVGSSECLPGDDICLFNEESAKEAKKDRIKEALCQIKNAELIIADYFKLIDERDMLPDGTYREGRGARIDEEDRRRDVDTNRSNHSQRRI